MDEENVSFLSGSYASSLFEMTDEELEQEKKRRMKVFPLFHITATNVFHSQLTREGRIDLTGKK
jgi:hypothetical protein